MKLCILVLNYTRGIVTISFYRTYHSFGEVLILYFLRNLVIFILLYNVNYLSNTVVVYMVPLYADYRGTSVERYVLAGGKPCEDYG